MREIKFRAKPDKACFFESDNVPTTDGFVFGTPDTRMLNVPGAEKWRKEHEMVDQPSIVATASILMRSPIAILTTHDLPPHVAEGHGGVGQQASGVRVDRLCRLLTA